MDRANAKLIRPGNIEDDLDRLKEADWIVEAVVEKLGDQAFALRQARRHREARCDPQLQYLDHSPEAADAKACRPISPAASPSRISSTRRAICACWRSWRRKSMALGERSAAIRALAEFADLRLGKAVVWAKDTPGFIANRIGAYWIQSAAVFAVDEGLTVEEADAVMGRPLGIPKTGIFGLLDLVGLDLQPHVDASLAAQLPEGRSLSGAAPRLAALRQDDRRGLHRPQRQGRLLSHGPRGRGEAAGGDRSQDRANTGRSRRRGWKASPPPRPG